MNKEAILIIGCMERYRFYKQLSGHEVAELFAHYKLYRRSAAGASMPAAVGQGVEDSCRAFGQEVESETEAGGAGVQPPPWPGRCRSGRPPRHRWHWGC